MRMNDFLKAVASRYKGQLDTFYGHRYYEYIHTITFFMEALAEYTPDYLTCKNRKPDSVQLEKWASKTSLDHSKVAHYYNEQSVNTDQEYAFVFWDEENDRFDRTSTAPRHFKRIVSDAIDNFRSFGSREEIQTNDLETGESLLIDYNKHERPYKEMCYAQVFVEGVWKAFYERDQKQKVLYAKVFDICKNLQLNPKDFYAYFDLYSMDVLPYDYASEELIDGLATYGPAFDGFRRPRGIEYT